MDNSKLDAACTMMDACISAAGGARIDGWAGIQHEIDKLGKRLGLDMGGDTTGRADAEEAKMKPGDSVAYKGYLIKRLREGYAISKGGYHIASPLTLDGAKAQIDDLVD